jgi:GAF domain-containing protein
MAKFRWPLQRLLDVKIQREIAARNELFRLSRELAKLRQEIIRRRSGIRTMLEELAACEFERRLPRQESVIRSCVVDEEQIRKLEAQLRDLEVQRSKKMEQFLADTRI